MMQDLSPASAHELTATEYLTLYRVTSDDLNRVRTIGHYIQREMDTLVGQFYDWLQQQREFDQFFHDEQTYQRVRGLLPRYWQPILEGKVDADYLAERRTVGEVHARIGLPLAVYFAAMNTWLELFATVCTAEVDEANRAPAYRALTKLVQMDTSVVVETYSAMTNETLSRQSRSLMAMSTPVTEIWERILLLPIVGVVDSQRAQDIMAAILSKVAETGAKIAILDVAGVAVLDTAVANHLIKVTRATKLMGCRCTISGVSPAIAQTMVELGIDVGDIDTTSTLRDALVNAFRHFGVNLAAGG